MRGQLVARAFEILQGAADVRGVDAGGEEAARLHHLVARVVNGGGGVIAASHQAELVGDLRVQREELGELNLLGLGGDRFEWPPNFGGGVGLGIEEVDLTRRAQVEDHDAGALVVIFLDRAHGAEGAQVPHGQAKRPQRAGVEEVAAGQAVAGSGGSLGSPSNHRAPALVEKCPV